jgi:hypothetical protein
MFRRGIETAVAGIAADTDDTSYRLKFFCSTRTRGPQTVIVFPAGPGAGKGDVVGVTPGEEGMVDKLRAVIAVDIGEGERETGLDIREGLHDPFLGFIEEGAGFSD